MQPTVDEDAFASQVADFMLRSAQLASRFGGRAAYGPPAPSYGMEQEFLEPNEKTDAARYATVRRRLSDVEVGVERYTEQDEYFRRFGMGTPALRIDNHYLPIDLGIGNLNSLTPETVANVAEAAVYDSRRSQHAELVAPEQAATGFRTGLQAFLRTRLFASNRKSPPGSNTGTGYDFTVTTNTKGLRIHYSPAYFVNFRLAFGAPTTPVSGRLQPGRYIFGAFPPNGGFWDSSEYDVPGQTSTAHLNV